MNEKKELTPEEKKAANRGLLIIGVIIVAVIWFFFGGENIDYSETATYKNTSNWQNEQGLIKDAPTGSIPDIIVNSSELLQKGTSSISIVSNLSTDNETDYNISIDVHVPATDFDSTIQDAAKILNAIPKDLNIGKITVALFNTEVMKDFQLMHFTVSANVLKKTDWSSVSTAQFESLVTSYVPYIKPD